jgi:DNA-binding MarR family transcriptional regulator/N-acetylglutamate synthase-like GNAT family acetyltransferase
VRDFNRFYTRRIGALQEYLLESPFTLAESRVLYELAHRDHPTATLLGRELGMDAGYLSRIVRRLARRSLIKGERSAHDGRQVHLALSARGRRAFALLDARSSLQVHEAIDHLSSAEQRVLIDAMATVRRLLDRSDTPDGRGSPIIIRDPNPGDLGWVVHRHGVLYAQEYGWDARFEGLVASIVSRYLEHFDPTGERCWIAERDGLVVGSVFLVRKTRTVGKLRMLYVEPTMRGLGLGRRLVQECIRTARQMGYRRLVLWTNSILHAARRIYEAEGFTLVEEAPHESFGHQLVSQTWELPLKDERLA